MCAVFGIVCQHKVGDLPGSEFLKLRNSLDLMEKALAVRGPDGQGVFQDLNGRVLIGHRRLAILGNSALASQPIKSASGRWVLSFNGQIYNYFELAKDLGLSPEFARNGGDTPVLAEMFDHFGPECVPMLDGMFAIAAWDRFEQRLFLLRDGLGIKPLYYHWDLKTGLFIFASQLGALRESGLIETKIDKGSLYQFLRFGTVFPPKTMLSGVKMLEPGTLLSLDLDGMSDPVTKKFWPNNQTFSQPKSEAFNPSDLRESFLASLKKTTRSDVPFGLFLSGGIDSVAIACGLKALGWTGLKTFTLGFDEFKGSFDETAQAKAISDSLGFQNFIMRVGPQDLADNFQDFVQALDSPSVDGFNTFLVSKLARNHVKVALSGLGGDELFFGYPQMKQFFKLSKFNSKFGKMALNAIKKVAESSSFGQKLIEKIGFKFLPAFLDGRSIFHSTCLSRELFSDNELESFGLEAQEINSFDQKNIDLVDEIRLCELEAYTGPVLLRDSDVLSMHFGLELRVPFLNRDFFDKSFSLGPKALFDQRFGQKSAFCRALKVLVPAEILLAKKRGFVLPMGDWITHSMQENLESLKEAAWLDRAFAHAQIELLQKNRQNWRKVWSLLVLDEWFRSTGCSP